MMASLAKADCLVIREPFEPAAKVRRPAHCFTADPKRSQKSPGACLPQAQTASSPRRLVSKPVKAPHQLGRDHLYVIRRVEA